MPALTRPPRGAAVTAGHVNKARVSPMKRTRASIKGSPIFDGNPAPLHDVRALLFAGVCHLFTRDHVPLEETADRALAEHQAFLGMALIQYLDHEVRCCLQHGRNRRLLAPRSRPPCGFRQALSVECCCRCTGESAIQFQAIDRTRTFRLLVR